MKQFVGRDQLLTDLHTNLQQADRVAITAIQGMGGIGKTELALQYALHHYQQSTYGGGICWVDARDLDVATQIINFATVELGLTVPTELELPLQVRHCWQHWHPGEVLVVFDDVTNYTAIQNYLPPVDARFKLLLTTRVDLGQSFRQVAIQVLTEAASLELLQSLVGAARVEQQVADAKVLCHWLGYLPLGLELVGRYLAGKPELTLATMLQRLQQNSLQARALCQSHAGMTATHTSVAAAFELSWKELEPDTQTLGCFLSLFALAPIPWQFLEQAVTPLLFKGGRGDPEALEDQRDCLLKLHLLQRVEAAGSYQLHQLIQEFLRAKLDPPQPPLARGAQETALAREDGEEMKRAYCAGMVQIAQQMPQSPTRNLILAVTPLMPHLAEAATTWLDWVSHENQELVWVFVGLARFYEGQGAYAQAQPWLEQCLKICRDRLGSDHPDVATSLNNLAGLYESQGRYSEAEPLYQQALALRQQLLGSDHPAVATSLNNLAGLYESQGRYSEAEPLYQQAMQIDLQALGEDHPDFAIDLANLAGFYTTQARYAEAEGLYLQALQVFVSRLGTEHPYSNSTFAGLANLVQQAVAAGQAATLSQHPLVQHLVSQLSQGSP